MLSFSGSLRVFVAVEACDMRKGFEGLSALVGSVLKEEVKSGALFAFSNRRRTRLKILGHARVLDAPSLNAGFDATDAPTAPEGHCARTVPPMSATTRRSSGQPMPL